MEKMKEKDEREMQKTTKKRKEKKAERSKGNRSYSERVRANNSRIMLKILGLLWGNYLRKT